MSFKQFLLLKYILWRFGRKKLEQLLPFRIRQNSLLQEQNLHTISYEFHNLMS